MAHQDFETLNAREWESESVVGSYEADVHPSQAAAHPSTIGSPVSQGAETEELISFSPEKRNPQQSPAKSGPRYPPGPGRSPKKKVEWARAEGTITTRKRKTIDSEAKKAEQERTYLERPHPDEDFPRLAYYLWPGRSKGETHIDLLGLGLQDLDHLRVTYKVYIAWDEKLRCINIKSRQSARADLNVLEVIKGIRQSIKNAKARVLRATPLYLITPPTASAIRGLVKPVFARDNPEKVLSFRLSGGRLSDQDVKEWRSERSALVASNRDALKEHLVRNITIIASLKSWMQMRISFGHINLTRYQKQFAEGQQSMSDFTRMMKSTRTIGSFERRIFDATTVLKLTRKIVDWPEIFCPAESQVSELNEVQPRHTMVLFLELHGENLRAEIDIDSDDMRQYQTGTWRLIRDERNTRVEVATVDIESQLDWSLEIITDNTELKADYTTILQRSLKFLSEDGLFEQIDELGLTYPRVTLPDPTTLGLKVSAIHIRSTSQYMFRDTGYVVEISIYRESEPEPEPEPTILAGVSLFHYTWDSEMESIEGTTKERKWNRDLSTFFRPSRARADGLAEFLDAVRQIQGLLSDATKCSENC